jgi:hypothetical protein
MSNEKIAEKCGKLRKLQKKSSLGLSQWWAIAELFSFWWASEGRTFYFGGPFCGPSFLFWWAI